MNTTSSPLPNGQDSAGALEARRRFGANPQSRTPKLDFQHTAKLALAHIDRLLPLWFPGGRKEGNEWVSRNPTRHDNNPGSFKINMRTGLWADFATGDRGGDLISLRAYRDGISQGDAANQIFQELGLADAHPNPVRNDPQESTKQIALKYWHAARPAAGSIVEKYLLTRGLPSDFAREFRFHASVRHREANAWLPAKIASVFQVGVPGLQAIHLTYLAADGAGKALVKPEKRTLGRIKGGGVWLGQPQQTLIVAEGIETALSVRVATGLPAVATLSCTLLPHLVLPSGLQEVIIAADNGEAGRRWSLTAADKWSRAGLRIRLAIPGVQT